MLDVIRGFRIAPDDASNWATPVDRLLTYLVLVSAFFTLLIFLLIVFFSIRYRRRRPDEVPPATRSWIVLELTWIFIPILLVAVMFFWGAALYASMRRPAGEALTINVYAKQWMWKLQHPDGSREINELHIPVGRPVRLVMTSDDVIHDFSVPAFRIKQDVLPQRFTEQWFIATRPGVYELMCAEFCGTLHSHMRGRVIAMQPEEYEQWLAGLTPAEAPALVGERLFRSYGCVQCHGQIAPTLAGVYGSSVMLADGTTVPADDAYLRESILNPSAKVVAGFPPVMPTYTARVTTEQLDDLIQYIKSLGAAAPATQSPQDRLLNQPPVTEPPAFPAGGQP
jgi:cytochrome c oxidase subunit 2